MDRQRNSRRPNCEYQTECNGRRAADSPCPTVSAGNGQPSLLHASLGDLGYNSRHHGETQEEKSGSQGNETSAKERQGVIRKTSERGGDAGCPHARARRTGPTA